MPDPAVPPLVGRMPSDPTPDAVYDAFEEWASAQGLNLYPAQEEALIEIVAGANVILATPTGSGKSLVAVGAHFAALAHGRRSYYTAPIKALVSEKFFALCDIFGADNVGMLTGDAAVNPTAPIICATAEMLANVALREGADADIGLVVMDEFHFYAEPGPRLGLAGAAARAAAGAVPADVGDARRRDPLPGRPDPPHRSAYDGRGLGRAAGTAALLLRHHADPRDAGGAADDAPGAGLRRALHPGRGDRAGAGADRA